MPVGDKRKQTLKSAIFATFGPRWPWPWISSYGIPSSCRCSTHRPLRSCTSENFLWTNGQLKLASTGKSRPIESYQNTRRVCSQVLRLHKVYWCSIPTVAVQQCAIWDAVCVCALDWNSLRIVANLLQSQSADWQQHDKTVYVSTTLWAA